MKMKFLLMFVLVSNLFFSQLKQELVGSSFIAKIGAVCEETVEPNPCAGYQIFLELNFRKHNVIVSEKAIRTCGEVKYEKKYLTGWTFQKPNKIILKKLNEDNFEERVLDGNTLIYENKKIIGKPKNKNIGHYEFVKNGKQ